MALSGVDFFRKVPKDLTNSTRQGGLLSLLVVGFISLVVLLETWTYMAGETKSKIVLDRSNEPKLEVHFEVSFYELPCRFANIEAWDYFGNAKLDVTKKIEKTVITGNNGEIKKGRYVASNHKVVQPTSVKQVDDSIPGTGAVIESSTKDFAPILKGNEFTFVLYYVRWCMYCQMALPVWKEAAHTIGRSQPRVKFVQIDCMVEVALCQASKISAYPTMMMYKGVHPLEREYHGMRSVDAFSKYIDGIVSAAPESHALKYHWHEGCLLEGTLLVNRVPGNFHIIARSDSHNFDQKSTNTSHIIHHFSFGPKMPQKLLRKIPDDVKEHITPLDGTAYLNHGDIMSHEHYIKVVATHYDTGTLMSHRSVLGYQMAVSSQQYKSDPNVPEARFSYDLSPTSMVIVQAGRRWYEFLTSLCAIVGGVFTTFSLMDGALHRVSRRMQAPTTPSTKLR